MTRAKVVDASVLAALAFAEPRVDEAAELLNGGALYAPTLIAYELCSVTAKKIINHPAQRAKLLRALDIVLAMEVRQVSVEPRKVVEVAIETGLTAYDASYVVLARALGAELLTLDERLRRAA